MSEQYWRDALLAALEDAGAEGALTAQQIDQAASVLAGAAETQSEVTGTVEIGRGADDAERARTKASFDQRITGAYAAAESRALQVGWPQRDPEHRAHLRRADILEEAKALAGLDRS